MSPNFVGVCLVMFFMMVEATPDGICFVMVPTGETKLVRKWKIVNGRRKTFLENVPIEKKVTACCEGYLKQEVTESTTSLPESETPLICIPQCKPPCTNGVCVEPNICKCAPGYELRNETCSPICTQLCSNGTCVTPGVCQCNDGFTLINGTCEPKCWPPCENGECIAPDTCSCAPGYEPILSNHTGYICEPICSLECINGTCIAPNICICEKGYEWQKGTCQPFCSSPCVNGTCIAPGTCECFEGYKKLVNHICVPKCTNGCYNGRCVRPEVCRCYAGFSNINGTCESLCSPPCGNGVCTSWNECRCYPGYELSNGTCEPDPEWFTTARDEGTTGPATTDTIMYDTVLAVGPKREPKQLYYMPAHWMMYAIPALVVLIIAVVIILISKRKSIAEYFAGRSYIVSDYKSSTNGNIPDVTFCSKEKISE